MARSLGVDRFSATLASLERRAVSSTAVLMAAYAECPYVLDKAKVGKQRDAEASAEVTPLRNPEYYQYEIETCEVAEAWRRGSVVALLSAMRRQFGCHAELAGTATP